MSVIAPGMSFSTLLMPLGLYTPFVDGIGHLDFSVLIPGGIGALVTVICLAKAVNALFDHFYNLAFHAIVGIVIAATVMIVPFGSFLASPAQCAINLVCIVVGVVAALLLDRFNSRVAVEKKTRVSKRAVRALGIGQAWLESRPNARTAGFGVRKSSCFPPGRRAGR